MRRIKTSSNSRNISCNIPVQKISLYLTCLNFLIKLDKIPCSPLSSLLILLLHHLSLKITVIIPNQNAPRRISATKLKSFHEQFADLTNFCSEVTTMATTYEKPNVTNKLLGKYEITPSLLHSPSLDFNSSRN